MIIGFWVKHGCLRIFRLPNDGAGDANGDDDIYVAVFGGGNGAGIPELDRIYLL